MCITKVILYAWLLSRNKTSSLMSQMTNCKWYFLHTLYKQSYFVQQFSMCHKSSWDAYIYKISKQTNIILILWSFLKKILWKWLLKAWPYREGPQFLFFTFMLTILLQRYFTLHLILKTPKTMGILYRALYFNFPSVECSFHVGLKRPCQCTTDTWQHEG